MAAGALGLTVAKLDEATVLIEAGITDVLIGFEIVGAPEARSGDRARGARSVDPGGRFDRGRPCDLGCGDRRRPALCASSSRSRAVFAGPVSCRLMPVRLASAMADLPGIQLDGVFTHAGNAYAAPERAAIEQIAVGEAAAVRDAAAAIRAHGGDVRVISVGSTPTAELVAREPGITELRPGNYVFYDAMQVALGTIPADRPALTIGVTVVSRPTPERAIVDGGAKTFGLERAPTRAISSRTTAVSWRVARPRWPASPRSTASSRWIPRHRSGPATASASCRITRARSATSAARTWACARGSSRSSSRSTRRAGSTSHGRRAGPRRGGVGVR